MTVHAEREHGASGDLQRHALHDLAQIDRLARSPLPLRDSLVEHRRHVRNEICRRTRRERRREGAALKSPRMALRNQKTVAEHGTKHADARRGTRIILVIAEQDMPDRIRLVQDETVAEEEAALDDVFLVGALPPG